MTARALPRRQDVLAVISTLAIAAGALWMLHIAPVPGAAEPTVTAFVMLFVGGLALTGWLIASRGDGRWIPYVVVLCASLALGVGALMVLKASPFPLGGLGGDER